MSTLPKYSEEKRKGNIGEAFVQYLLSKFCLVHKIDGSYDIGNDFICELIKDKYPTNLLFYVQVKHCVDKPSIKPQTRKYWKGSPIPVYVFWVKSNEENSSTEATESIQRADRLYNRAFSELKAFYIRYTPKLHRPKKHRNVDFKSYRERDFKRDLIVDYARTQYFKGFTPLIEPRMFLNIEEKIDLRFREFVLYTADVIPEYSRNILSQGWTNLLAVAALLLKKGGKRNLKKAKESILLAKKLVSYANRRKVAIFKDTIQEYEQRIDTALRNLEK